MKACPCTVCGRLMEGATPMDAAEHVTPRPGDVAICFDCQHVMLYADDLTLRDPTDAEIVTLNDSPIVRATLTALSAWSALKAARGKQ